jgi:hypothetical protein
MYSLMENIAVAAIVIAILGKTFYSTYKTLKAGRSDSAPVCTGSCASCRACSSSRQLNI